MHIEGEQQERDLASKLGTAYASPFADRALPSLQPDASLAQWLAHAEAKNGALEAAFREWTAAIEDVPQMATQDTTAMLGVEHTLDGGAALDRTGLQRLVVAGGVGANTCLRVQLNAACAKRGVRVHYPELALCTDNGAMIALAAGMRLQAGLARADKRYSFEVKPRWALADAAA
jgi:tRNA A37 threonylcarbamoyltransferase TsaD